MGYVPFATFAILLTAVKDRVARAGGSNGLIDHDPTPSKTALRYTYGFSISEMSWANIGESANLYMLNLYICK